jgi:hypothetical protein
VWLLVARGVQDAGDIGLRASGARIALGRMMWQDLLERAVQDRV